MVAFKRQQKQSLPQSEPPAENESLRPVLQNDLTQKRGLTNFLVEPLQRQGLGYIDQQRQMVFIKRDLNGEKSGVPLKVIQKISGHKTLSALQKYLDVLDEDLDAAVDTLKF